MNSCFVPILNEVTVMMNYCLHARVEMVSCNSYCRHVPRIKARSTYIAGTKASQQIVAQDTAFLLLLFKKREHQFVLR